MSNVHTLNDIKDREGGSYKKLGYQLGNAYEQELKKKLRSVTEFNFEINDLSEKLVDKYNEREKFHLESQQELEAKYTVKIQSFKSEIKTLKRKATLFQKASSLNKNTILSLEAKVHELEDVLRKARLNSMQENSRLREIISKKDNEIADLSNPSPPPINDSSQKLPG
ncbi:hypothetical protein RhiirA4_454794 [Rhizophagus irregularis]|uniref:Uncharacterized protein n=1 Tax=Rhizophagus irregularis TaxID=588596 RepID=A0A2I1G3N5_9GLOM|nr:hypothetical protein RhiirA4_454794 [Rhizophagus irregularis]